MIEIFLGEGEINIKIIYKVIIELIIIFLMFNVIELNTSMATNDGLQVATKITTDTVGDAIKGFKAEKQDESTSSNLKMVIRRFLGVLRIISGLVLVIVLATTGFKYITSTPDVKAEIKSKMFPVIMGLVLVYGAVSIATFFVVATGN